MKYLAFATVLLAFNVAAEGSGTEVLIAEPPEGWERVYEFTDGQTRVAEFVPPGSTTKDWPIKVSFESFANTDEVDPLQILLAEVKRQRETCERLQDYNLFSGFENNYPVSTRMILCGKQKQQETGEVNLFKAIGGDEFLYLVRIVKRVPAFSADAADVAEAEIAAWTAWLKRISACHPGDSNHPCPAS